MKRKLKLYLVALAAFLVIDLLWLGVVMRSFYQQQLGFIMAPSVNWPVAILFYLLFVAGLLVFVILPGLQENSLKKVLLRGGFFGLVTYATYDLTNLATLKDWPVVFSTVDLIWGVLISVFVSTVGFLIGRRVH
jgi:uncharacterized membrane protein